MLVVLEELEILSYRIRAVDNAVEINVKHLAGRASHELLLEIMRWEEINGNSAVTELVSLSRSKLEELKNKEKLCIVAMERKKDETKMVDEINDLKRKLASLSRDSTRAEGVGLGFGTRVWKKNFVTDTIKKAIF